MQAGALMSAAVVRTFNPYAADLERIAVPAPGPGEVRIRVSAAGVSFVDALTAHGDYQVRPTPPYVPGSECAGTVDAVGDGVTDLRPGDRVAALAWGGTFAEVICTPAGMTALLPEDVGFEEAAVLRVAYTTALHALVDRGRLQAKETVLVLGAAGSIGQASIQLAKAMDAFVVAAARSEDRRAAALAAGADRVIDGAPAGLREALSAALGGRDLDVVLDPVGGAATSAAFRSLGWGGRHLVVGFASDEIPSIKANLALLKGAALIGVNVGRFTALDPAAAAAGMRQVLAYRRAGLIRPRVDHVFPLAAFEDAMTLARGGRALGRIVLKTA